MIETEHTSNNNNTTTNGDREAVTESRKIAYETITVYEAYLLFVYNMRSFALQL